MDFLFSEGYALGDFNRDGNVDMEDMLMLINCATGPAVLYDPDNLPEGCALQPVNGLLPADLDEDGDIDSTDFAIFQRLLGS
jgi:hypothetical protein